ncbi:MAG: VanW family protein [Ruminococcus sp.]|nr:VanW family protein [Ruminococcus sp.]
MKCLNKESIAKRAVAFLLVAVMALPLVLGACDRGENQGATADSSAVDVQSFVFPEGFVIGTVDVSGMAYNDALEAVEDGVGASVKAFTIKITAEDKEFEYKNTDFKWSFGVEEALKEAIEFARSDDYTPATETGTAKSVVYSADVSIDVDESSVDAVVDAVAKEIDVKAVDSTFSVDGDEVVISKEKAGKQLDKEDLKLKLGAEILPLASGSKKGPVTIKAVVNEVAPQYKFESLDGEIKLLATYTTYSENTLDGDHNMALALASCNGSVINPGEVWSFNECTGDSNLESLGYRPATVIMNGKFEQGIGGGICQASSTIYNAAIMANMEIVERYCHAYQSSYVPAGRDATIDYPNLDLKLSNPTEYPMYMQCYMENAYLTVNIFGWDDPAFDRIEIESAVDSSTSDSYRASAWRVYYLDDKEVGREELPTSWYDYPKDDDDETTAPTKPKETKPKATKPQATKPKATKPAVTEAPETKPQATKPAETVPTEPVEVTTAPVNTQVPEETSSNEEQIPTATVNY